MEIKDKLKSIILQNFGSAGIRFINENAKKEHITDLDMLPLYRQKRFVNTIIDEIFKKVLTKEKLRNFKLIIFSQLFGKEETIDFLFQLDHLKGTPPIRYMYFFFGYELAQDIIKIEEKNQNIKNIIDKDDPTQMQFCQTAIAHLFNKHINFYDKIKMNFSKFLKYGDFSELSTFVQLINKNPENIDDLLKYIDGNIKDSKEEKEHIRSLLEHSNLTDEKKKELLATLSPLEFKQKITSFKKLDRNIEEEIIQTLSRFTSHGNAKQLIKDAKKSTNIYDLEMINSTQKSILIDYIINNTIIQSFSPQKANLIESWLSDILKQ